MAKVRPYLFYDTAVSLCTECLRRIEAKLVIEGGRVWMYKWCPAHGSSKVLIATDADYWRAARETWIKPPEMPRQFNTPMHWGCPYDCGLCPDHMQHSCLTIIEVTDHCNLKCPVCYADSGPHRPGYRTLESIEAMLDAVLTPAPANPLCWDLLLLQADEKHYTVRHAQLSLAPALLPPERCPRVSGAASITMPLAGVAPRTVPGVQWRGVNVMTRSELGAVVANHCEAAAFLQFARAPFLVHRRDGWVIGDARYDREPGLGFAELLLGEVPLQGEARPRGACPAAVPWERPRADLLPP